MKKVLGGIFVFKKVFLMITLLVMIFVINNNFVNVEKVYFWSGISIGEYGRKNRTFDYYLDTDRVNIHDNNKYCRAIFDLYVSGSNKRAGFGYADFFKIRMEKLYMLIKIQIM